ncbi:DNA/RNA non-specific endonuclease [Auraticoccus cholistanensis]|uniref:DNA/RNA non-specific endonuclease n=1 Tax=Auraticoccus cholistanensis TaxID=2656650 RepID=UPI0038B9A549
MQLPRRFWKVAACVQDDELHSTGYLLDQSPELDDIDLQGAAADQEPLLGPWRTFQVPVAAIADMTGLDFGSLAVVDRLDVKSATSGRWRQLEGYDDIGL